MIEKSSRELKSRSRSADGFPQFTRVQGMDMYLDRRGSNVGDRTLERNGYSRPQKEGSLSFSLSISISPSLSNTHTHTHTLQHQSGLTMGMILAV